MSRCANCRYTKLSRYNGYVGLWICLHPYRGELDNRGEFSYPKIESPNVTIVTVDPGADAHDILKKAETPRWCYYEAVRRSKKEQPGFDPARQRKSLEWLFVDDPFAEAEP